MFHKLDVLPINDGKWDRVCGLGSETRTGHNWVKLLVFLERGYTYPVLRKGPILLQRRTHG